MGGRHAELDSMARRLQDYQRKIAALNQVRLRSFAMGDGGRQAAACRRRPYPFWAACRLRRVVTLSQVGSRLVHWMSGAGRQLCLPGGLLPAQQGC